MESRSINGLQHILLSMKSAHEAQAEAPELNPNRLRKTSVDAHKMGLAFPVRSERQNNFRRLKKAVQQGRSERRGVAYEPIR